MGQMLLMRVVQMYVPKPMEFLNEPIFVRRKGNIMPQKMTYAIKQYTPWPESASELYEVTANSCGRCHVVSVTDPYGSILGFLDRSRYFFIFK
jgi:hypothetical protein